MGHHYVVIHATLIGRFGLNQLNQISDNLWLSEERGGEEREQRTSGQTGFCYPDQY